VQESSEHNSLAIARSFSRKHSNIFHQKAGCFVVKRKGFNGKLAGRMEVHHISTKYNGAERRSEMESIYKTV
jgi:hypothetical protein